MKKKDILQLLETGIDTLDNTELDAGGNVSADYDDESETLALTISPPDTSNRFVQYAVELRETYPRDQRTRDTTLSEIENVAEDIKLYASKLSEATNGDDALDAKIDLDHALKRLDRWLRLN